MQMLPCVRVNYAAGVQVVYIYIFFFLHTLGFIRLFQVKMEREQYQTEIRDLQDQLSEMHDELDSAKKSVNDEEKDGILAVKYLPHTFITRLLSNH